MLEAMMVSEQAPMKYDDDDDDCDEQEEDDAWTPRTSVTGWLQPGAAFRLLRPLH